MTIDEMLASPESKEALQWLREAPPNSRTLGEIPTTRSSINLVETLYGMGAKRVTAIAIHVYETGEENTGRLVVSLPENSVARRKIFEWCGEVAQNEGFDAEQDVGQRHIFVMLD